MQDDHVWECAYIDWANGAGTVTAGPTETYDEDDIDTYHGG